MDRGGLLLVRSAGPGGAVYAQLGRNAGQEAGRSVYDEGLRSRPTV